MISMHIFEKKFSCFPWLNICNSSLTFAMTWLSDPSPRLSFSLCMYSDFAFQRWTQSSVTWALSSKTSMDVLGNAQIHGSLRVCGNSLSSTSHHRQLFPPVPQRLYKFSTTLWVWLISFILNAFVLNPFTLYLVNLVTSDLLRSNLKTLFFVLHSL